MPMELKSQTITEILEALKPGDLIPIECLEKPGDVLRIDFMEEMNVTPAQLARAINVPPQYISKVLHGGGISAELGILLDKYFGLSEGWWSRLQADYNTRVAKQKLGDRVEHVVPVAQLSA